ncbi:ATP-binding cassette, subfamily B (MDR/TAP), member 1, partial [Pseudohyphozyma bogoriensis]
LMSSTIKLQECSNRKETFFTLLVVASVAFVVVTGVLLFSPKEHASTESLHQKLKNAMKKHVGRAEKEGAGAAAAAGEGDEKSLGRRRREVRARNHADSAWFNSVLAVAVVTGLILLATIGVDVYYYRKRKAMEKDLKHHETKSARQWERGWKKGVAMGSEKKEAGKEEKEGDSESVLGNSW